MCSYYISRGAIIDEQNQVMETPLHVAAWNGHVQVSSLLISKGAAVDAKNKNGETPLHVACHNGHVGVCSVLLTSRARADAKSNTGETPLYVAAGKGHMEVSELLLAEILRVDGTYGVDEYLHYTNNDGRTPLHIAVSNGHEKVSNVLLQAGARVEEKDNSGETTLHEAARCGHVELTSMLISKGARVDATNTFFETPLHLASFQRNVTVVQILIGKHGACLHARDIHGCTPLHYAAVNGHVEMSSLFVTHGARVNVSNNDGRTPLHLAAFNGHAEVGTLLIRKGAYIEEKGHGGQTPLHEAVKHDHMGMSSLLLSNNASINVQTNEGETPLHVAALNGNVDMSSFLIAKGALVDVKDNTGNTPLHAAVCRGHVKLGFLLLRQGADVNASNCEGTTALIAAAFLGLVEMVTTLLEAGADVTTMTSNFEYGCGTALDAAHISGHQSIYQLIANHKQETLVKEGANHGDDEIIDDDERSNDSDESSKKSNTLGKEGANHGDDEIIDDDERSNDSDESSKKSKVGEIQEGTIMKYADLKAEIARCASDGFFKVNYEKDSGKKYKGRTRILCKCSAAGKPRGKQKKDEEDDDFDTLPTMFSKSRRRVSLKTRCPWRLVAWCNTKTLCGDTMVKVTLISNEHECNPCEELLEVVKERCTEPKYIPPRILEGLYTLVRYGSDTRRIRMFIINEGLDLKTDAQSIVNLKLLMLRTGGLPQKLHQQTTDSLEKEITSVCKDSEITNVFAELQRIEQPEGRKIRNALEYTRSKLPGFDYRVRVGEDGELLSCIWQTARMRTRLRLYGGLLYLDGKAKANVEEWPIFFPTILDCNGCAHRVGVAVSYVEDGATTKFVLEQLRSLCPDWYVYKIYTAGLGIVMSVLMVNYVVVACRSIKPTIQMDSKIGEGIIAEVIPLANVQVCTFHWLRLVCPTVSTLN
jgi:ankyrin repeat protein